MSDDEGKPMSKSEEISNYNRRVDSRGEMLDLLGYKKVRINNNWESLTFFSGDDIIRAGMNVSIMFNDQGSPLKTIVHAEDRRFSYSDMGHMNSGSTTVLYVMIPNEYDAPAKAFLDQTMRVLILKDRDGDCGYAEPCGCRQYQGTLPKKENE